jgi:hypothetical protein
MSPLFHCKPLSGHHRGSPMFCNPIAELATGHVDWLLARLTGCWSGWLAVARLTGCRPGWQADDQADWQLGPGWLAAVQVDWQKTRLTGSWVQGDWLPSRLTGCRPGWLADDQVDWLRAACGGLEDSCTDHALIVIHTNALKPSWK